MLSLLQVQGLQDKLDSVSEENERLKQQLADFSSRYELLLFYLRNQQQQQQQGVPVPSAPGLGPLPISHQVCVSDPSSTGHCSSQSRARVNDCII